jgi:hypothetical protein
MAKGDGRKQRANSPSGQLRAPDLSQVYTKTLRDITPGEFDFRVILIRTDKSGDERTMILDRATTSVEWNEEGPVLGGSLALRRPAPEHVRALPIKEAHRIRLLVRWGGTWFRLWEMGVVSDPEPTGATGELTCELADDLAKLRRNERHWVFKKDKHRKDGWPPEDIARAVAKKEGIQLGKIAKGEARIKKLDRTCSGLEILMFVYAQERKKSNRKFVIKLRDGKLEIVPVERSKILYEIKGLETEYSTQTGHPKKKHPVTVIEAKGRIGRKKVEVKVFRRAILKRFGLAAQERSYGKVNSKAELREEATRDLADEVEVHRKATITIPGIPFLERGDTVRWITNEPGWSGPAKGTHDRSYGYTTTVSHTVTPANYETTFTLTQKDPYLPDAEGADQRDAKKGSREKNKKKGKGSE